MCERVDEVDCSKAVRFYDLNLDLYAARSPPADDHSAATNNNKETVLSTTQRSTTTTATTTTARPTTTNPPPQLPSVYKNPPTNPPNDRYSSFNYYLRTPHAQVESGYNSQSQQSYLINKEIPKTNGRKVPSGPKTIIYTSSSSTSSTQRPHANYYPPEKLYSSSSISGSTTRSPAPRRSVSKINVSTTTKKPVRNYDEDEYYYEYYDDEYPAYSSAPAKAQSNTYGDTYAPYSNSKYNAKQQTVLYEKREDKSVKDLEIEIVNKTSTAAPEYYYYDDDYYTEGDSKKTNKSPVDKSNNNNNSTRSSEYYDEEEIQNVNQHHFQHVDVPRIPYSKPNVPRVLVTNGKPFLPRLRRQSMYNYYDDDNSMDLQGSSSNVKFSEELLNTWIRPRKYY